jgi:isopentenyldiphosphate isomerase
MSETVQYEVLDEQGHKTGRVLDRSAVHQQELWHEVVNVWVMNSNGEVLMQQRGPGMELNPGLWDVSIGTHVKPGEDPLAAAMRCLQTELGIQITTDNVKHLFNIQSANPMGDSGKMHRVLGHVFLVRRDLKAEEITVDSQKIALLAWRPMAALMADIGNTETAKSYFPRAGNYYPKLFEAFMAESGM